MLRAANCRKDKKMLQKDITYYTQIGFRSRENLYIERADIKTKRLSKIITISIR